MEKSPYQTLVERIVKEIPEIMELKFGCRIQRFVGQIDTLINITCRENNICYCTFIRNQDFLAAQINRTEIESWEVFGRPITLSDILITVKKEEIGVDNNGNFWIWEHNPLNQRWERIDIVKWDLTRDLSGQSEETISFLIKILGI